MFGTFLACQCHVALVGVLVLRPLDKQSTHLLHFPVPGWEQRLAPFKLSRRPLYRGLMGNSHLPMTMSVLDLPTVTRKPCPSCHTLPCPALPD